MPAIMNKPGNYWAFFAKFKYRLSSKNMKKYSQYIALSIISCLCANAVADNHNGYREYGLAHTYGYFIQKRAASTPVQPGGNTNSNTAYPLRPGNSKTPAYKNAAEKEANFRTLANDNRLGAADRGWIKQEINRVDNSRKSAARMTVPLTHERGMDSGTARDYLRNPPGKQLAY